MLFDEPFGALDPITRDRLQISFQTIRRAIGFAAMFVTHDVTEALLLGDRIAVMNGGHVVQIASPRDLLRAPADEYVEALLATPRRQAKMLEAQLAEAAG